MLITPMCRTLALHEIFDEYGVNAGDGLPLSELEQAWRATGLRTSDLEDTLADGYATGEFVVHDNPEGSLVVLTERGFEQAQRDLQTLEEIDSLIRAYAMLTLLKRRRGNGFAYGRRRIDKLNS